MKVTLADIKEIEKAIERQLPQYFVDFYVKNGYGPLPDEIGGCIYSPSEIIDCISAPIYYFLGSMMNGEEWATKEEHDAIWKSNGKLLPNHKFSMSNLTVNGYDLTNCLQIGSNGACCYHWITLSGKPTKYCLATDSGRFENCLDDIAKGVCYVCPDE